MPRDAERWLIGPQFRAGTVGGCILVLMFGWLGLAARASEPTRSFNVAAGEAEQTLNRFVEQAGVQLIYEPQRVVGIRTPAVRGTFTVREALEQLLAGTLLQVVRDAPSGALAVGLRPPAASPPTSSEPAGLQSAPRPSPSVPSDLFRPGPASPEMIPLSPFEVTARNTGGRYLPTEALSGGRVRVEVFDSTEAVSVIPREMIDDVGSPRVLDAAKYVSGITGNIIPNGLDFITIRGFATRGQTIDGFNSDAQINLDPVIIDRYEIVKGPNAILSPAGVPGGTINLVSKKPVFSDFALLSGEVGRFDSDCIETDINRVEGKKLALRLIAAGQEGESYVNAKEQSWLVMPMLTYRFSQDSQLTLQGTIRDARIQNYMGLPIDPSVGSTDKAVLLRNVDRFLNIYDDNFRWERRTEGRLFFTSNLTDSLSVRVAVRYLTLLEDFQQNQPGGYTGGATNPLTGLYTPGVLYDSSPPFSPSAANDQSRVMPRGGRRNPTRSNSLDLQNDYVYTYENRYAKSTSLAGYAFSGLLQRSTNFGETKPAIDFDHPSTAHAPATITAITSDQYGVTNRQQLYVNQVVETLASRLVLNAGYMISRTSLKVWDYLSSTTALAEPTSGNRSYGILVKPLSDVAVFYSYSDQSTPLFAATIAAGGPALQEGRDNEFGVRSALLDRKLTLTVVHYDIKQTNNSVTDPRNTEFPPPDPLFPNILFDRRAKGWEFEMAGSLTENLSITGNFTAFTNRDPNNVEFRATAERSWAVLTRYEFKKDSAFSGLAVGVGVNYLAKRPGDQAEGFTAASTAEKPIPVLPTFYLPARTLVDLSLSYRYSKQWSVQLNLDNVFNTDYLEASESRFSVWPGVPFNARLRLTRRF